MTKLTATIWALCALIVFATVGSAKAYDDYYYSSGENNGYYVDDLPNGQSRCRNSETGKFANNENCGLDGSKPRKKSKESKKSSEFKDPFLPSEQWDGFVPTIGNAPFNKHVEILVPKPQSNSSSVEFHVCQRIFKDNPRWMDDPETRALVARCARD